VILFAPVAALGADSAGPINSSQSPCGVTTYRQQTRAIECVSAILTDKEKDHIMTTAMRRCGFAIAASCALAISATTPSQAFPALTHSAATASSISDPVIDVRYAVRGGGRSFGHAAYGGGGRSYGRAAYGGRHYAHGYGGRHYGRGYHGRYYGRGYYGGYGYYGYGAAAAAGVILGAAAVNSAYYYVGGPAYYSPCSMAPDGRSYYGQCY